MSPSEFRFLHPLRVRWAETDMQGIVFNGHYLTYCDVAITEYWRAMGYEYPKPVELLGIDFFVVKASLEYHAPACYDDELHIGVRMDRIGNSSMTFKLGVFRGESHLITGEIIYVSADPHSRKPLRVPDALRGAVEGLENG
ncbi:MAG: thioesterase family protein [Meiothermus sp.]|nr:thioesterase family protein [Meiothermus sp.]